MVDSHNPAPPRTRLIFQSFNFTSASLNFTIFLSALNWFNLRNFSGKFGFPPEPTNSLALPFDRGRQFHCHGHDDGRDSSRPPTSTNPSTTAWRKEKGKRISFAVSGIFRVSTDNSRDYESNTLLFHNSYLIHL